MNKIIIFLLFMSLSFCFGQKTILKKYDSDFLDETRSISIYLPKSYEKDSISNFPLTLVLDGQKLFDLTVGVSSYFAATDNAPEQIIVGVDMSQTRNKDTSINQSDGKLSDNARNFYQFLKNELLPYVEANYKTSPFLTLLGTGATGNFINYFLQERNPIFNAYISLNPTLTKDTNGFIASLNLKRLESIDNTYYYYLSSSPYIPEKNKALIKNLKNTLFNIEATNFNVKYDDFINSPTTVSAMGESVSRAFSKIFEVYSGISKEEFDTKVKNLDPPSAIAYLETKYLEIDFLFGSNLGIRERDIIAIESIVIDKENGDYLKDFGKMILKLYPQSQMGHYYLGLYYETGKKYKKALEHYRIGYGKIDPSDPKADKFYMNIERVLELM